jgi:hypothetical protein
VLKIEDNDCSNDEDNCIKTVEDYEDDEDDSNHDESLKINDNSYENASSYKTEANYMTRKQHDSLGKCKNIGRAGGSASSINSSSRAAIEDESIECSRLTTGDTGYTSNLDTSISSMSSLINLKGSSKQSLQKPVIVTNSHGVTAKTQINSLKQLKTNMSPLSNLKYVKNA